jgi:hypothetical protein
VVEFWPPESTNYIPRLYEGAATWSEADHVAVHTGADTPGIDALLEVGGSIEGHAEDADTHQPIAQLGVCALPVDELHLARCAVTDSGDDYAVVGLETESYEVAFIPYKGESTDYVLQYYDEKADWFESDHVAVEAGAAPVTGIDAHMHLGGTIAGTVTDAGNGGALVAFAEVKSGIDAHLTSRTASASQSLPPGTVSRIVTPDSSISDPAVSPFKRQKRCRKGWHRVRRHGRVRCVKRRHRHRRHRHHRHSRHRHRRHHRGARLWRNPPQPIG